MPSQSQFTAPLSEVEADPSAHYEPDSMATEETFDDQVVGKAMETDESEKPLPPSATSSSSKRKRVRFDLPSEAPETPEPVGRRYRKLRCIDNDIKREKKRALMLDADETNVDTRKRKKLTSPPPTPSPVPQQSSDAHDMKAEDDAVNDAELMLESQGEPQPQQKRRPGPVYYHMRLRERLARRDAATLSAPNQEGDKHHGTLSPPSLYAPPTLPAALAALKVADEDQVPES
ncbi:hypothetical protein PG989_010209 [Apiospora arundinis]